MKFEIDKGIYLRILEQERVIVPFGLRSENQPVFGGLTIGSEIFLPPRRQLDGIASLLHEAGHVINNQGLWEYGNTLQPREARKIDLPLSFRERMEFFQVLASDTVGWPESAIVDYCARVLRIYTKNSFDLDMCTLHFLTEDEYLKKLRTPHVVLSGLRQEEGVYITNFDKAARNDELPAMATQVACLTMIENGIGLHIGKFRLTPEISFSKTFGAHQRAKNIVMRAYAHNYYLPEKKC